MNTHPKEIQVGKRFGFGKNWSLFLEKVDEKRILQAKKSLTAMLETETWQGRTFLDIGSGSGLFSLAARRLGAAVFSFDFDPSSASCTKTLKSQFSPDDPKWRIEVGSILDQEFLTKIPPQDIVYSWGVLHHTGKMWQALEQIPNLVKPGGSVYLAIYNDQGPWSIIWKKVKQIYNILPNFLRPLFVILTVAPAELKFLSRSLLSLKPSIYFDSWTKYESQRGMSRWHDLVDWIGGYPFEVAKPEEVFDFFHSRGFELVKMKTCGGGLGCNEFVFQKKT